MSLLRCGHGAAGPEAAVEVVTFAGHRSGVRLADGADEGVGILPFTIPTSTRRGYSRWIGPGPRR